MRVETNTKLSASALSLEAMKRGFAMNKLRLSPLLWLVLVTLGCGAVFEFPDDNMMLLELEFDGQRRFCQVQRSEELSTLDVSKYCTFVSIPLLTPPPFTWKNKEELESLCEKHREDYDDEEEHFLYAPCRALLDHERYTEPKKTPESSVLNNSCEARRIECEKGIELSQESFSFSRSQTCGISWDCAATVKEARTCLDALELQRRNNYSDLSFTCNPDTWERLQKRKERLAKEAEKWAKEGKDPPLPPECKELEKCL